MDVLIGIGIGVLLTLLGVVGGIGLQTTLHVREERRAKALERKPICGCGHHASFHDESGCHKQWQDGYYNDDRHKCGCQKYLGPPPEAT